MESRTYGGGPQNGQPQWSSGGGIGEERGEPQRTCGRGLNEGSRILAPWSLVVHQIRLAAAVSPKQKSACTKSIPAMSKVVRVKSSELVKKKTE